MGHCARGAKSAQREEQNFPFEVRDMRWHTCSDLPPEFRVFKELRRMRGARAKAGAERLKERRRCALLTTVEGIRVEF